MNKISNYFNKNENKLIKMFLKQGYLIINIEELTLFKKLKNNIIAQIIEKLNLSQYNIDNYDINNLHEHLHTNKLNDLRLHLYNYFNKKSWFSEIYYNIAREIIHCLVGNELAMQQKINFSIQLPDDSSSLIDAHIDSFSGETPYQIVVWIPLVDVYDSKSMYIIDPQNNRKVLDNFKEINESNNYNELFNYIKDDIKYLKIKCNQMLVFTPNLLHGNIVNKTNETRISLNCRFTGLFTPYLSKERTLGNFYKPITMRPVSALGNKYTFPNL